MRPVDFVRLIVLAGLWGAAFISLRAVSPVFGAVPSAGARVLIGGAFLLGWFFFTRYEVHWAGFTRHYAIVLADRLTPLKLAATLCYGIGSTYVKKYASQVEPRIERHRLGRPVLYPTELRGQLVS